MSYNAAVVWGLALKLLACSAIFGVTAYAVFWLDRSGWWFLLAAFLAAAVPSISREE